MQNSHGLAVETFVGDADEVIVAKGFEPTTPTTPKLLTFQQCTWEIGSSSFSALEGCIVYEASMALCLSIRLMVYGTGR